MIRILFFCFLAFSVSLVGCSDSGPSDKVIQKGYVLLQESYSLAVKPEDAYATRCTYKEFKDRHFAHCGIDYGGTGPVRRDNWEILNEKSIPAVLALNGKASSALEKIWAYRAERGVYGVFRVGYRRASTIDPSVFPD